MEIVPLFYHLRNLGILFRHGVGHEKFEFHILVVHFKPLECLDMLRIVGVVVDGGHGAQLVESPHKHTLGIHVGESQRAHHFGHPSLAAILLHGIKQGF